MESEPSVEQRLALLIEKYRDTCLWFLRRDYVPSEPAEIVRVLDAIERHSDRSGFAEARALKRWFSQHSSERSAV